MLEDFLAQQRSEGHRDSSGSFTISAAEAKRKLVQSGLDTAERGLLKLVQLGVDSLCQSIDIKLLEEKVQFWFHQPARGLLDDPDIGEDLQCSLLACVYSGFDYAAFTLRGQTYRFDRESISPIAPQRCPEDTIKLELGREAPAGFWASLRALTKARTNDYLTFLGHLGFCPIPLQVDGVRPTTEYRSQGSRALDILLKGPNHLAHLGVRVPFEGVPVGFEFDDQSSRGTATSAVDSWESFARFNKLAPAPVAGASFQENDKMSSVFGMLYAAMDDINGGFIDVVKSGVHVGRLYWRFPGNVSGVVTAEGLDLDLSGLALVQNRKADELLNCLRTEMQEAAAWALGTRRAPPLVERHLRRLMV